MRLRLLPVLALALLAAGCDSGDDALTLDAAFYTGTWGLVSVADATGDRTGQTEPLLDDLRVTFDADGTFTLVADFSDVVNQNVRPDETITGTFQASSTAKTLVLISDGVAALFQADATASNRVALTAPASIVTGILGELPFDLQGDVTIVVQRR
ncbi:hypothetical protein [Rubrivirga sp. IMCC45206]|uniref:hypothetical protein n=1 Tax=Rubrivirga sp. IMCC45206 TaxID=3391614 RepID=UPI00398FCEAE